MAIGVASHIDAKRKPWTASLLWYYWLDTVTIASFPGTNRPWANITNTYLKDWDKIQRIKVKIRGSSLILVPPEDNLSHDMSIINASTMVFAGCNRGAQYIPPQQEHPSRSCHLAAHGLFFDLVLPASMASMSQLHPLLQHTRWNFSCLFPIYDRL